MDFKPGLHLAFIWSLLHRLGFCRSRRRLCQKETLLFLAAKVDSCHLQAFGDCLNFQSQVGFDCRSYFWLDIAPDRMDRRQRINIW